jgi:hypothetical protein
MSDRPVAEISYLYTTTYRDIHATDGIRSRNPSKRVATGIGERSPRQHNCVFITYIERKPLSLKDRALIEDLRHLVAKLSCWYRPRLPSVHEPFVNANLRLL